MALPDAVLRCPNCGALTAPGDGHCAFCHAALATQLCPRCARGCFVGFEHCPSCGAELVAAQAQGTLPCPSCHCTMGQFPLGDVTANRCGQCFGIWLGARDFDRVCEEKEDHAAVLGAPALAPDAQARRQPAAIHYVPCPLCQKLMNRVNFAHCSGVIVDTCKLHGIWFDRYELHAIVTFIEDGGIDKSRSREREHLALERELLRDERESPMNGALSSLDPDLSMALNPDPRAPTVGEVLNQAVRSVAKVISRFRG